jgi:hypothetical protein
MSTILASYSKEPPFPVTDQNPLATRFNFGTQWFDVLNGPLTQAEVDAWNAAIATAQAAQAARPALLQGINADVDYQDFVSRLQGKTAAQVKTYVQANVTDLASARLLLAKVLLYIARTI